MEKNSKKLNSDQKYILEHVRKYPEEIITDKYGNKFIVYRTYQRSVQCFT